MDAEASLNRAFSGAVKGAAAGSVAKRVYKSAHPTRAVKMTGAAKALSQRCK